MNQYAKLAISIFYGAAGLASILYVFAYFAFAMNNFGVSFSLPQLILSGFVVFFPISCFFGSLSPWVERKNRIYLMPIIHGVIIILLVYIVIY